jgi:ribosomal protein L23
VTEKGAFLSTEDRMVYVFEVSRFATKHDVAKSVAGLYKVVPEKVAILKVPAKRSFVRGRITKGKTGRKAYVYLKKGDKIENL